jgi:hypothetical protein
VEGKSFRLADEVRYIQRRAADHDGRIVTLGQDLLQALDAVPGEGSHAVLADAVDAKATVFREHADRLSPASRAASSCSIPSSRFAIILFSRTLMCCCSGTGPGRV